MANQSSLTPMSGSTLTSPIDSTASTPGRLCKTGRTVFIYLQGHHYNVNFYLCTVQNDMGLRICTEMYCGQLPLLKVSTIPLYVL